MSGPGLKRALPARAQGAVMERGRKAADIGNDRSAFGSHQTFPRDSAPGLLPAHAVQAAGIRVGAWAEAKNFLQRRPPIRNGILQATTESEDERRSVPGFRMKAIDRSRRRNGGRKSADSSD